MHIIVILYFITVLEKHYDARERKIMNFEVVRTDITKYTKYRVTKFDNVLNYVLQNDS